MTTRLSCIIGMMMARGGWVPLASDVTCAVEMSPDRRKLVSACVPDQRGLGGRCIMPEAPGAFGSLPCVRLSCGKKSPGLFET